MFPTARAPLRRTFRLRAWLVVSVLAPLSLCIAASWYDHRAVLGRARDAMSATTHALAEHGNAVLQTAALALDLQLDRVKAMTWQQIGDSESVHQFLVALCRQLPQLQSAFYVDVQGYNSASSRAYPINAYDDRDRPYFRAALKGKTGLYVSAPFRGQAAGTLGFVVSRPRIVDGHFDGLAAVTLSPEYFRDFYQTLLQDRPDSGALLMRADGTILVRYPPEPKLAYVLSADSPLLRALAAGREADIIEVVSILTGKRRLLAYREIPGMGLVVAYSIDVGQVLHEWYQHVAIFAAFAAIACFALLLTAQRAMRQAEREQLALQTLLDETERRRRAEEALQQASKMEALGQLTGGVAHDFNNLLAAVMGSLELALRRVTDATIRRHLGIAQQAAERGARLTAQMLAFARKQTVDPEPVDANAVIRSADELLRRTCGSMVQLRYELGNGLWHAMADPMQLELALLNLLANARDAMPVGGEVVLRTRNVAAGPSMPAGLAERDHVLIAVADTGSGMAPEVLRRAFEPFFTTKGRGKGTGLGLSMVYGFAEQCGGHATIDSSPGQGTTVTLYLARTEPRVVTPPSGPSREEQAGQLRILLADDDAAVRVSAGDMLSELGHTVTATDGGAAAVALLEAGERFDLLLVDFVMPDIDGGAVATVARRLFPNLPILFMTGYAEKEPLQRWAVQGYRVLDKPFDLAALASAMRDVLSKMPAG